MAASILLIGISRNVNCDNMVGFPKSGYICNMHTYINHDKTLASYVDALIMHVDNLETVYQKNVESDD